MIYLHLNTFLYTDGSGIMCKKCGTEKAFMIMGYPGIFCRCEAERIAKKEMPENVTIRCIV